MTVLTNNWPFRCQRQHRS